MWNVKPCPKFKEKKNKKQIFSATHQWGPDVPLKSLQTVCRSCETDDIVTY